MIDPIAAHVYRKKRKLKVKHEKEKLKPDECVGWVANKGDAACATCKAIRRRRRN